MAKMGRPVADNPASERIIARLTVDELTALEAYCEASGKRKSDAIREAIRLLLTTENGKHGD